jgi:hypothetical protein
MTAKMKAEPSLYQGIGDEADDLVEAIGLLSLAIEGHNYMLESSESSEWDREAMSHGAS